MSYIKHLTKFKGAKGLPTICQIVFCNPRNLPKVLPLSASDILHVIGKPFKELDNEFARVEIECQRGNSWNTPMET